jgi:hypothetical protein
MRRGQAHGAFLAAQDAAGALHGAHQPRLHPAAADVRQGGKDIGLARIGIVRQQAAAAMIRPGVQNPHWIACSAAKACCTG